MHCFIPVAVVLTLAVSQCHSQHRSWFSNSKTRCGYDACLPLDSSKVNVHLIAHSHDDVGWLKTVDQYFYGLKTSISRAGVQYTFDTMVKSLLEKEDRRFIVVETSFFWMWWRRQTDEIKVKVRSLVDNGQLEFISGGWSMNDEADVHYNPVIDQMTLGHRTLVDAVGECAIPKIGWQIDPFGHSREQAALFAQMAFDGVFFGRLDHADKGQREKEKRMEFVWRGSQDLGSSADLFTGILPNGYSPPAGGFNFDDLSGDDGIVDDPDSEEYNVPQKVHDFIHQMDEQSKHYATDNLIVTLGEDFQYQNAHHNFKNIDLLIKYVNAQQSNGSRYNLFYSTPTCYVKALNDANRTWTSTSDDFFPYSSDPHAYWTGYYTSRPATKVHERKSNAFLQTCKQLNTLSGGEHRSGIDALKRAVGVAQHHDAVAGTEKQHVANDYALQLNKGTLDCEKVISESFFKLASKSGGGGEQSQLSFCPKLNVSQCEVTESAEKIAVVVYNPRSQPVRERISIPWSGHAYTVTSADRKKILTDLIEVPQSVRLLAERSANSSHEIVFQAKVPALGFTTFLLEKTPGNAPVQSRVRTFRPRSQRFIKLKGKSFSAVFASDSGELQSVTLSNGQKVDVSQQFLFYKGMNGDNTKFDLRASGAYIFRPNGSDAVPIANKPISAEFVNGKIGSEVRQVISESVSQVVRVSPDSDFIEFDWLVGPIPVDDDVGKEYISRFTARGWKTGDTFYTDANGRQIVKRVKDQRETWQLNVTEPVAGNYYPVNSRIFVRDEDQNLQMTVLTDRTQGGSSLSDGAIELMVHRRLLHDDAFGVGEALNEPGVDGKGLIVRGTHRLLISSIPDSKRHRDTAISMYLSPQVFFAPFTDATDYGSKFVTEWSAVRAGDGLPPNVHLLTLEQWTDDSVLIRLEHFYESKDDPNGLSEPVTVSLPQLLKPFVIVSAEERTMSASQSLSSSQRLSWRSDATDRVSSLRPALRDDLTIELKSMEIRTLVVKVKVRGEE